MSASLISRQDAEFKIGGLADGPCSIAVMEERAFANKWLPLGEVALRHADATDPTADRDHKDDEDALISLAQDGTFEWSLPSISEVTDNLTSLLRVKAEKDHGLVRRCLNLMASIAARTGLVHPAFDPAALEDMPFRRATTVVSDTSGVLQGGLDFVVRHIPTARVKIPAIVQMEIRNFSHRFFKMRRDTTKKREQRAAHQLMEHLKSQGGERVLLRLELKEDVEIERTYLLGDPLRSAFERDTDRDLAELQLSVPLRAYVDRLVLEAARHHQAQSEPGHAVLLLTSDQEQARMALAEGVRPLYFRTVEAEDVFGQHFTGRPLDPFTGEPRPVSMASLLWELATAFGKAWLCSRKGTFTVSALGENLPWSPFHSMDDLLWCEVDAPPPSKQRTPESAGDRLAPTIASSRPTSYQRLSVNQLLTLVCALDDNQVMDEAEIGRLLSLGARSVLEYRKFLLSAGCIRVEASRWSATERLRELSVSTRNEDPRATLRCLAHAPSFQAMAQRIEWLAKGKPLDLSDLGRSSRTYQTLGEITLLCASADGSLYPTLSHPQPADFAELALRRFRELAGDEKIVATGHWLESLIRQDGIHPEVARRSLEQASEAGFLRRSTEGSTAQTRYGNRVVHVLRVEAGTPAAKPIQIYRGDYLIPGKASVSLRLEEPKR